MTLLGMLRWSLELDYIFLFKIPDLPTIDKVRFVILKYISYVKIKWTVKKKKTYTTSIFGQNYYYNDSLGLASLQRVYCSSYVLKSLIPDCTIVIDVGANVGQFNFFCRHYLRSKRIISIEPIKECFDLLVLNSNNVNDCINEIVGVNTNELIFNIAKDSPQLSSYIKNKNVEYIKSYAVRASKLDELLKNFDIKRVNLLKVDTEGSELDVLNSSVNLLGKVDHVLVEMSIFRNSSGNLFKTGSFLEDKGFSLIAMPTKSEEMPIDIDGLFRKL